MQRKRREPRPTGARSAFAREQGRDLETLKRWVQRYYPDELCKYSNCMVRIRGTGEEWKGNRLTVVP